MAETFSIGTHVTALWGHRWYAGVVDDILDGGRAYEIAWADEETCNEVPAADVRALAVNEEPRPKKQKVQKPRADTKPQKKRLGASPFVEKPLAPAADESEWAYRARARRPHRRIRDDVDANDDHCSVCRGKLCCATCPRSVSSVETRRECQNDVNAGRSTRPACAIVWARPTCRARGGPSSTSAVPPCVEINSASGAFPGDDAAVLARSSGEAIATPSQAARWRGGRRDDSARTRGVQF